MRRFGWTLGFAKDYKGAVVGMFGGNWVGNLGDPTAGLSLTV
jgi:hypothetical protein